MMNRAILVSTALLAGLQSVSAHASISKPRPLGFTGTPNDLNPPLAPDFSNFPCKGLHTQEFQSAETWVAGQETSFIIANRNSFGDLSADVIAAHSGGSCQASISRDGGKSFQVIHSFIGDCPRSANGNEAGADQEFKFMVPQDEPAGEVLFAWTWFPATANREFYMNCAFITIENSNPSAAPVARPNMFVGFLAPGACAVDQQTNLDFPEPGEFVTDGSQNPTAQFKGKTKPSGSSCGNPETGGGEPILNSLPPNQQLASSGGSSPNPNPNPEPRPIGNTDAPSPTTPASNPNAVIVTVTETVTNAVTDVVLVTSTVFAGAQSTNAPVKAKRETVQARQESCDFEENFSVGDVCAVPSTEGSTWPECVWRQFCPCLDDNLSNQDIANFADVKKYCDCLTKGRDCPAAKRYNRRQVGGPNLILSRSESKVAKLFRYFF